MNEMTQVLGTVAMEPKGEWDSETYYEKLNVVQYNDSSYMATEGVVGEIPSESTKWQLIGGGVTKEYLEQQTVDNLDSTSTTRPLSANQGNNLNKNKIEVFDTVALMKAANLKNNMTVETLGYYSVNDGGKATYKIRTKTNDDVVNEEDIIALADNTLIAELVIKNGILNVKQFGVKGDNVTEDSTKLQDSIDYAESNNYGVYIPNGRYKISTTLNVTGCSIRGESSTNTILSLNDCDGMLLKQYNKDTISVIKNIAFGVPSVNVEIAGITYQRYGNSSSTRSRGYHLTDLYFYGLGCGIEIQDAFNNIIEHIRMNACFRCLYLKNQVVQCTFNNITANYDLDGSITSTRFGETVNSQHSIGVEIGLKGETERPEGIKLNQVCCTNYDIGCVHRDSLYFNAFQCEFDLSRNRALMISSGQGGTIFDGCWFANKGASTNPIVEFTSASTTDKYYKALINCTIYNQSTQSDVIGVGIGNQFPYGWNMNVINCNISNGANCQLKYGIQLNRCKGCTLESNSVYGCETDIKVDTDGKTQIINNKCDTINVTAYAGTTVYALNNIYTAKNITMAGTLIGNFD